MTESSGSGGKNPIPVRSLFNYHLLLIFPEQFLHLWQVFHLALLREEISSMKRLLILIWLSLPLITFMLLYWLIVLGLSFNNLIKFHLKTRM